MAAPNIDLLTLAQLEAEFINLGQQLTVIQNDRMAVLDLIQRRKAEARARERVRTLTPLEKDALRSVLSEP